MEKIDEGQYRVLVTAIPERGKANEGLMEILANHFQVAKSSVRIVLGKTAREKLVDVAI